MSSSKDYRDYILEKLQDLSGIICRPMMGEYLLYLDGILFGGIYDDRLLVKKTITNEDYHMEESIPYKGAKPMYFITEVDNPETLKEIILNTCKGLKK